MKPNISPLTIYSITYLPTPIRCRNSKKQKSLNFRGFFWLSAMTCDDLICHSKLYLNLY